MGLLVLAAVWLMMHLGDQSSRDSTESHLPGSQSRNVEGCLLFYTLCERLGFSMERSEAVLDEAVLDRTGVLILLDPWVKMQSEERQQLSAWVAAGGVLITDQDTSLLDRAPSLESRDRREPGSERGRGKRRKAIVSVIDRDADAGPLGREVAKVAFEDRMHFSEETIAEGQSRVRVLFRDTSGVRILQYSYGGGCLICLSEYSFLQNKCMVYHDNPVLASNLLAYAVSHAKRAPVIFDEYHHGSGRTQTGMGILTTSLLETSAGWSILCLFAAGILLLMLQGRQFGSRLPLYQDRRRRSKTEFIESLGATYRAAGARRFCLQMIDHWFRRRLAASFGLPANADSRTLASAAARGDSQLQDRITRTLDECEEQLRQERLAETSFLKLTRQLKAIEGEVYREH